MRNTLGLKSNIYIEPEGQFCMGQNKQIAYNDLKVISRLILQCLKSPETIIHQQTNNNQKQNADSKDALWRLPGISISLPFEGRLV